MNKLVLAVTQMACTDIPAENIAKVETETALVKSAPNTATA